MLLRRRRLLKDSLLLVATAAALIALLSTNRSFTGPYGYQQATIESMQGRLVHVIGKGKRGRYAESQYVFQDLSTGKFRKLHDLFTMAPNLWSVAKGQIVELSYLKDQLLDCRVGNVKHCAPKCISPSECETLKTEVMARKKEEANIIFTILFVGWSAIYSWRRLKARTN